MRRQARTVRLSSKGQIVIPAAVRRELGLKTGGTLRIRTTSAREIVLSAAPEIDLEAIGKAFQAWEKRTGRDVLDEFHEARRKARAEEAAKREAWSR